MSTKIVIVAGQRFQVAAETDNEAIRQQLLGMGFADVANAAVKEGSEGDTPTIEFIKKAGTKGSAGFSGAELAAELARVPALAARHESSLLRQLLAGELTVEAALAHREVLIAAMDTVRSGSAGDNAGEGEEARLCTRINVPARAAAIDVW